jgi:hypothetical protein
VDTAGNATESALLTAQIVPDATAPIMVRADPAIETTIPTAVITDVNAVFNEPVVTPVTTTTMTVRTPGADGKFDTADDVVLPGEVQWLAGENTIRFHGAAPFVTGRYQVTLSAGLADAAEMSGVVRSAGNSRWVPGRAFSTCFRLQTSCAWAASSTCWSLASINPCRRSSRTPTSGR